MNTPPALRDPWEWIQPRTLQEICERLRDCRDLAAPPKERENMCSVALETINFLRIEVQTWRSIAIFVAAELENELGTTPDPNMYKKADAEFHRLLGRPPLT